MTTLKHVRAERRDLTPSGRPRARISTDELDSQRDRVFQSGLSFRSPMRVLLSHDAAALPVGLVTSISRGPRYTEAEWQWFENDEFVDRVSNIYSQGGLDASIGFMVEEAEPNLEGGYDITKAHVVEFSLTAVPANAGALALAKSLATRGTDAVRGDDIILTLRDAGDAPGGRTSCPGPSGTYGGEPPCPHTFPKPVSACPGSPCPLRGENITAALVLIDAPEVDYSKRTLEETIVAVLKDVIVEEVTKQAREWTTRVTGRID